MGNSSILIVLGLVIMLGIFGAIMNQNSIQATVNYTQYHSQLLARNANAAALQLAMRSLADSSKWRAGFTRLSIAGSTATLRLYDTTDGGKKAVMLVSKSPYLSDAERKIYDTATSTVVVRINLVPPVVRAAWTAFGPLERSISDMYVDGRDHTEKAITTTLPVQYELVPNSGYYGVSTGASSFSNLDEGYIGGTNRNTDPYTDIKPAWPNSAFVVETNSSWPKGFPKTPDEAMGWDEGTLEKTAKSGVGGSRYITTEKQMDSLCNAKLPLKGVTFIDVSPSDTEWSHQAIPDGSGGLFVFHCKDPKKTAFWNNITGTSGSTFTFRGLMVFDKVFHFHMNCLGAVVELTQYTVTDKNCGGNADKTVAMSTKLIEDAVGIVSTKGGGGWRGKLDVRSWFE